MIPANAMATACRTIRAERRCLTISLQKLGVVVSPSMAKLLSIRLRDEWPDSVTV